MNEKIKNHPLVKQVMSFGESSTKLIFKIAPSCNLRQETTATLRYFCQA